MRSAIAVDENPQPTVQDPGQTEEVKTPGHRANQFENFPRKRSRVSRLQPTAEGTSLFPPGPWRIGETRCGRAPPEASTKEQCVEGRVGDALKCPHEHS